MPVITIRSLPFAEAPPMGTWLQQISADFARGTGIDEAHITLLWHTLPPGHCLNAGRCEDSQPTHSQPLQVHLLIPDFNGADTQAQMMTLLADCLSRHTPIARDNIFIHLELARSGQVFDAGEIVHW